MRFYHVVYWYILYQRLYYATLCYAMLRYIMLYFSPESGVRVRGVASRTAALAETTNSIPDNQTSKQASKHMCNIYTAVNTVQLVSIIIYQWCLPKRQQTGTSSPGFVLYRWYATMRIEINTQ